MKRLIPIIACLTSINFVASVSYAAPENLALARNAVVAYHDSGEYERDFNKVVGEALTYLKAHDKTPKDNKKKLAIVLDIDETSLSNYPDLARLNFGGTMEDIRKYTDKGKDKPFAATLALYQYAISHKIAVIFLTGRNIQESKTTVNNLKRAGFTEWDRIIFREGVYKTSPAALYKTAMRKSLEKQGYQIILNMGDQMSDLAGGYSEKNYKLPNPFYLIA